MEKDLDIGKKIKEIRMGKNLSQERFGKKIGKSGKTVSAYECGKCAPSLSVLDSISQVYDVSFLHLKKSKQDQLKAKLQYLKDILQEIESTLLNNVKE